MKRNKTRLFLMSHIMIYQYSFVPFPHTLQGYVCWDPLSKASRLAKKNVCAMPRTTIPNYNNRISIYEPYLNTITRSTEGTIRGPQYGPFPSIQPEKRHFEDCIEGFGPY